MSDTYQPLRLRVGPPEEGASQTGYGDQLAPFLQQPADVPWWLQGGTRAQTLQQGFPQAFTPPAGYQPAGPVASSPSLEDMQELAQQRARENPMYPPSWTEHMVNVVGSIPRRAFEESERLRTTGEYDPAPVVDAATLTMTGAMPFAERGALGIFGGRLAKTADQAALARAEQMAAKGAPREDIWNNTGWFQGPDKQWRFEIPDNQAVLGTQNEVPRLELAQQIFERSGVSRDKFATPRYRDLTTSSLKAADFERSKSAPQPMSDVLSHPGIYRAYPSAESIGTRRENMTGIKGHYNPDTDQIAFGNEVIGGNSALRSAANEQDKSTILHELQHAIQRREDFPRGSNPNEFATPENIQNEHIYDSAYLVANRMKNLGETAKQAAKYISSAPDVTVPADVLETIARRYTPEQLRELWMAHKPDVQYRRTSGEVEARNVQSRMNMTPEERRARPPWLTEDVPLNQQIIRK